VVKDWVNSTIASVVAVQVEAELEEDVFEQEPEAK
jgi:hypothetical protein